LKYAMNWLMTSSRKISPESPATVLTMGPEEHDDERDEARRRDLHEALDERADQPGLLGETHADHGDEDDSDDAEAVEVVDGRGEQEPDAVGAQQRLDVHGHLLDLRVLALQRLVPDELFAARRHLLADVRLVEGHRGAGEVEHVRQHDHQEDEPDEDHGRVRHLVASPLDRVEGPLQDRLLHDRGLGAPGTPGALGALRLLGHLTPTSCCSARRGARPGTDRPGDAVVRRPAPRRSGTQR
jgi:hypothetical protein